MNFNSRFFGNYAKNSFKKSNTGPNFGKFNFKGFFKYNINKNISFDLMVLFLAIKSSAIVSMSSLDKLNREWVLGSVSRMGKK